jgi:hypothetical protein
MRRAELVQRGTRRVAGFTWRTAATHAIYEEVSRRS